MNLKNTLAIFLLIFCNNLYAQEYSNVTNGARQYDWDTCIQDKTGDCLNGCQDSEDIHCGDNCKSLAKDKCISLGLSPSQ